LTRPPSRTSSGADSSYSNADGVVVTVAVDAPALPSEPPHELAAAAKAITAAPAAINLSGSVFTGRA
jgi:hypothetical protein